MKTSRKTLVATTQMAEWERAAPLTFRPPCGGLVLHQLPGFHLPFAPQVSSRKLLQDAPEKTDAGSKDFWPPKLLCRQNFYNCTRTMMRLGGAGGFRRSKQSKSLGRRLQKFCDLFARNKRDADNLRKSSLTAPPTSRKPTRNPSENPRPKTQDPNTPSLKPHSHSHTILSNNFIWEYVFLVCPNKPTEMKMFRVRLKLVRISFSVVVQKFHTR